MYWPLTHQPGTATNIALCDAALWNLGQHIAVCHRPGDARAIRRQAREMAFANEILHIASQRDGVARRVPGETSLVGKHLAITFAEVLGQSRKTSIWSQDHDRQMAGRPTNRQPLGA